MDDEAMAALMTEMLRAGVIGSNVVDAAADRCEREGNAMSAHRLRCLVVEAEATTESEWTARRARSRMRLVPDGGNDLT